MSSLLDHLDNNHSDDDEDDHINRLFPKCKPRASSLSLSPSLQLQPFGDDSTSTSTSDSQLPTSELTVSFSESKNRNINYRHNNNQFNHSSSRRHSSNSSNFNYEENHALLHSAKQCDRDELVAHEIVGQTFTQYYENNNFNSSKSNLHSSGVSPSSIPLVNSKSYSGNLGKTSIPLPTNFKSRKSESNHFHNQQHQQQHQHPRNTSKTSRREHSNSNNSVSNSSYHPPRHHRANNTNTSGNHRGSYETVGRIEKLKVGSTSPSFISNQSGKGKNLKGGQRDKGREKLLNLSNSSIKSPSSLSLASHSSVAGMECDTLDDHFDNGIGSGGSGSSSGGSNSHSNGSAFSENILSGSVSVGNMTAAGVGSGSLRDSRIEIAGGREIFSQNRIRAGRRLRGSSSTSSSTEMMVDPSVTSASTTPSNKTRRKSPNSNPQYQHQHHQQIPQGNSNSVVPSVAGGASVNSPGSSNSTSTSVWERNNSSVSSKKSMGLSFKGVPGSHRHHTHGRGFGGHHQQSHVKSRHGHSYGHGYDYSKSLDYDVMGGGVVKGGLMPQVHATSPSSAVTMKETVFSSEITSIEKAVTVGGTGALKSPIVAQESKSPSQVELKAPFIYETPVGGGEIVFDDIEDWQEDTREEEAREGDYEGEAEEENDHDEDEDDHSSRERRRIRNRSPQSQLHLLEVLMKDNEGKVSGSSSGKHHHHHHNAGNSNMVGLLDGSPCPSNPGGNTTPSGYESDECSASASAITSSLTPTTIALKTSPNHGNKRLIGNIPIAEYEGSPKRYGLRQQSHTTMPTHLDLVDVGMELNTESEQNRSAHMQTAQCLQSQSTPAPTSSSSSSLDNTNTVASSNSSSRINYNRISPRVLSPSQSLSGYPPKVPGFPQRVTSAPGVSSSNDPVCMDNNTGGSLNASGTLAQEMARESADEMAKLAIGESRNSVLTQNVDSGECSSGKLAGGVSALTSDLIIGQLNVKLGTSDLSPDDSVASQQGSNNTTSSTSSDPEHDLDRRANLPTVDTNNENDDLNVMRRSLPLSLTTNNSTGIDQDYLYEFSETRKVLEEFFKVSPHLVRGSVNASEGGELALMSGERPANFDELDYTLRRQAGNSYVGQRLAGECAVGAVEESPKKPPRRGIVLLGGGDGGSGSGGGVSPRLISFQEVTLPPMHSLSLSMHTHSHSHLHSHSRSRSSRSPRSPTSQSRSESHSPSSQDPSRDVNDNDIDAETTSTNTETDLGETEVGLQVGHSRNFTLSPETTDCDSNELESEMSLDYEASVHSSSRVGVAMPVLEDGLSSGNVSENDDVTGNDGSNNVDTGCAPGCSKRLANSSSTSRKLLGLSNNGGNGIPTVSSSCGGNIANTVSTNTHNNAASQSAVSGIISNTIGNASVPCSGGTVAATPSEANPTLLLMKKQISEIEKEIKLRASQQCQRLQQQATNPVGDTNGSSNGAGGINANGTTSAPPPPSTTMSSTTIQQTLECNNSMQSANAGRGANNLLGTRVGIGDTVAVGGVNLGIAAIVEDGFSDSSSRQESSIFDSNDPELEALDPMRPTPPPSPAPGSVLHHHHPIQQVQQQHGRILNSTRGSESGNSCSSTLATNSTQASGVASGNGTVAVVGLDSSTVVSPDSSGSSAGSSSSSSVAVAAAIQDIKDAIQRTKSLPQQRQFDHPVNSSTSTTATTASAPSSSSQLRGSESRELHQQSSSQERLPPLVRDSSPVWVPRQPTTSGNHHHHHHRSANAGVRDPLLRKQRYEETPDDDADTDQETDRLLGQNRTDDDYGFYDDKEWKKVKSRSILPSINKGVSFVKSAASATAQAPLLSTSASSLNNTAASASLNPNNPSASNHSTNSSHNNSTAIASTNNHSSSLVPTSVSSSSLHSLHSKSISPGAFKDSQLQLPSSVNNSSASSKSKKEKDGVKKKRSKEDLMNNPSVLIEGVLFRARYLGSTQLVCEGQPTKATRMMQAEEAVSRIKAQANQNGSVCQNESQVQQQSIAVSSASTTPTPTTTTTMTTTTEAELKSPSSSTSHVKLRKKSEESGEFEDYLYAEDEESCCEDESLDEGDGDEDFFDKARHQSPGSLSLVRDNKRMAMGLDDIGMGMSSIHGSISSSALQMHNHHSIPQSLLNNRESEIGNSPSTSTSSSTFQVNPPCATALPGTMFRLRFVGSLEVEEEIGTGKRRRKRPKKTMVEEAVMKMKAPEGETQPSTEVDLFISTEKIMVLNTDLKEIMMDHALRTISYIADIGDLVVLMARRRPVPTDTVDESKIPRPPKMICHVFESDEAQYIAQSIGQAFQVAYMEFLKANGIEDHSFVREMDYQEVLNSQEIFGDELQMFAKKELQKEVVVPKTKGEILGVVIVESGWGSMLPTVVIANLAPAGAAARCGQLNIGDQIIAINGVSLVGLPLSTCQNYIKNTKTQTVVKLTVVPCPPVVEVKIKRPDTKYQLGFSVQNGVICSLLRGGIAERGGVRVGHRIIEINNQSVVAVPHEKIVNLLATSVGEINMKTMPTSMFRLLTGQETPLYI